MLTLNYEACSSFKGVSSNQRIVTAKIRLSTCRNKTQTAKITLYDLSSLNNRGIGNKYMIAVRNKFDNLQEASETLTPNSEYENFINTHMEAAAECIPTKPRAKHRVPWETLVIRKNKITWKLHPYVIKETHFVPMHRNLKRRNEN